MWSTLVKEQSIRFLNIMSRHFHSVTTPTKLELYKHFTSTWQVSPPTWTEHAFVEYTAVSPFIYRVTSTVNMYLDDSNESEIYVGTGTVASDFGPLLDSSHINSSSAKQTHGLLIAQDVPDMSGSNDNSNGSMWTVRNIRNYKSTWSKASLPAGTHRFMIAVKVSDFPVVAGIKTDTEIKAEIEIIPIGDTNVNYL